MKLNIYKKIGVMFLDVFVYLFLIISILFATLVFLTRLSKNDSANIFNYEFRTIETNSMQESEIFSVDEFKIKSLPKNTLIVIEKIPENENLKDEWYKSLKVGDVLTFTYTYVRQEVITHRISSIKQKKTGGYVIELVGDNRQDNETPNRQIIDTSLKDSHNYVIGKVVNKSKVLGNVIVWLKNPVTLFFSLIMPSVIIILYQIFKIILYKLQNQLKEKDNEIARLKTELENLSK